MSRMRGTVKFFSVAKGYGFIQAYNHADDIFVHESALQGNQILAKGDQVTFDMAPGRDGRPQAVHIQIVVKAQPTRRDNSYYGRRLKKKDSYAPGAIAGTVVGGVILGPPGAIAGGLLGLASGDKGEEIKATCLRCNGVGRVTSITQKRIGFQCENCRRFWTQANREGLKDSDVDPL